MSLIDYSKEKLKVAGSGNILSSADESTWDFYKRFVERASFSDSVSHPDATLVLAGPALFEEIGETEDDIEDSDKLTPIGFVTDITIGDQQVIGRIPEIGSGRPRLTIGDNDVRGNIRRGLFNGNTLAYALYQNSLKSTSAKKGDELYDPVLASGGSGDNEKFYKFGLWSDMFKIPFGLALCMRTIGNDYIASMYLEQMLIENYEKQISRGQAIIFEDMQWVCERIRTVKIKVAGSSIASAMNDEGTQAQGSASSDNSYPGSE
jgi:hypothetical protein